RPVLNPNIRWCSTAIISGAQGVEYSTVGKCHFAWNPGPETVANYRGIARGSCHLEREPTVVVEVVVAVSFRWSATCAGSSRGPSISNPQTPQLCSPMPSTSSEGMYIVVGSSHIKQRMVSPFVIVR
ncbi:hypothetical protein, partial [Microbacterium schleiferi]|uniref:hypothetical protein n=1 Tax=Microbacterium schleiferi TaxID=69362 RepID=UPI001D170813